MNRVEPNRNVYIGHRYVPLLVGEWDKSIQYEGLSIVTYEGASYTSKKRTPSGIDIENEEYWVLTGNYNAQIEYYRQETERVSDDLAQTKIDVNQRIDETVEYVDSNVEDLTIYINDEVGKNKAYVDGEVNTITSYVNGEISTLNSFVETEISENREFVETEISDVNSLIDNITTLIYPTMTTQQIQEKLNQGGYFKFLRGIYNLEFTTHQFDNYDDKLICLDISSNTRIEFEEGAVLKTPPTSAERYYLMTINGVENVNIIGGELIGDRDEHAGTTGEWGFGVAVAGSKKVNIIGTMARNFWGDGFYISSNRDMPKNGVNYYSEDIYIEDVISDNNRRQGLSLITGKNIYIKRGKFINTNGTSPQAGIDIEPNNYEQYELKNVVLDNVYTGDNKGAGILLALAAIGDKEKSTDIKIINHVDDGSNHGISFNNSKGILKGMITVENPTWINSYNSAMLSYNYVKTYPKIKINNPVVENFNRSNSPGAVDFSAFVIQKNNDDPTNNGNIDIVNPLIQHTDRITNDSSFYINDRSGNGVIENINIINPINLDNENLTRKIFNFSGTVSDSNNQLVNYLTESNQMSSNYYSLYSNRDATQEVRLNITNNLVNNSPEFTLVVESNNLFVIALFDDVVMTPSNYHGGKIQSNVIGSSITIKKVGERQYRVIKIVGDWEVV